MASNSTKILFSQPSAGRPARGFGGRGTRHRETVGGAALVTDAKYKYKPLKVDPDTGELLEFNDIMTGRMQRFILQSVTRKLLPKSRTNNCLRVRQGSKQIQVLRSIDHGTTSFSGLQTCGSVWQCPVCAAKIAERRRSEVLAAMSSHKAQGGTVDMLTLTCPHQRTDQLDDLLAKQAKALNYFWMDRHVKAVLLEMENAGHIKATEVTHGRLSPVNNGWHPHYHILLFNGSHGHFSDWKVRLYLRWANACELAGLGKPSFKHGIDLQDGSHASKYISKWGLEDEITKGHTKKAIHGETPFDLLRALVQDDTDRQAAALFIEFANCFKGKRQLRWSKGLKSRFAVEEKDDETLANEKDDFSEVLGMLTIEQWRDVLAVEGRGILLSAAARTGWAGVLAYLDQIEGKGVLQKSTRFQKGNISP
jgi:hypothetical protein